MKALAIGDTHGNTSAICNLAIPQAKKNDCPIIVQCGDFGYWEHTEEGRRFLNKVSKHLVRNELEMLFVDGNHDNHPLLWEKYLPGPNGLVEVRPNLWYVPRGTVFKLGDVTCLGVGGAFSIDKEWRLNREALHGQEQTLWWPTEMIRPEDTNTALRNIAASEDPIQVMFTHDAPTANHVPNIDEHVDNKWKYPQTWENRDELQVIFDVARPQLLVHGHYHIRYSGGIHWQVREGEPLEGCRVEGLANDGLAGFAIVLDFDSMFSHNDVVL